MKCRFSCNLHGRGLQCPPKALDHHQTRELLDTYRWALVVEGTPPGFSFHSMLLALEREAFLSGLHKAFALGAGPCPVCETCPENGVCRYPQKARPSMEGCGIDVCATARRVGIRLNPVRRRGHYVKYIGMLLLE